MDRATNEKEIIVRLFQLSNALQTYIDSLLKEENLTTKQFFMMIIIGSFEYNPRLGELSDRFGTSRQNVKQVLLKLEKAGYVKLYKDEKDTRVLRVTLTEQAAVFWNNRDIQDTMTMSHLFSSLSLEELNVFNKSLQKTSTQVSTMMKKE